ncbi:MAG: hypothetical protein ABI185_08905 [Ginsengibacter sp.]
MKYFTYLFLIITCFFSDSCKQSKKDITNKLLKVMSNFTTYKKGEIDTCWLTNNHSLSYDTCFLVKKNQKRANNFLLLATKKYSQKDDYSIRPNTQIVFAKSGIVGWNIIATDTIYTQGDIDIWSDSLAKDSSIKFFIKASVGNNGNLCAYLYKYFDSQEMFKKIKGYESLPNATFSTKGNLISSLAVSGQYSLRFYHLVNDTIYEVDNFRAKNLDSFFFYKMQESVNYLNNYEK